MAKKICLIFMLLLIGIAANAQNQPPGMNSQTPYQIPQTVYVGDRATLVLPLPNHAATSDIDIAPPLISSGDIELHRVYIESRASGNRLIIEFTAFAPGRFEIPPFEAGGLRFSGLRVEINSILDEGEPAVLSELASPLSIPGTSIFIYGVMAALVLALLAAIWASVWGRRHFAQWLSIRKQRRLISLMAGIEKRMRKALLSGKDCRFILDTISSEYRSFLSLFCGVDCRAMSSAEFGQPAFQEAFAAMPAEYGPDCLPQFFRRCDTLRFGGGEISASDTDALLGELRDFLAALYRAVRENGRQGVK